jgi:hypothetical protein
MRARSSSQDERPISRIKRTRESYSPLT